VIVSKFRSHRLYPWLACLLSAALNVSIFPRIDFTWLAFVCMVPLFSLIEDRTPQKLFGFFWLSGFLFQLGNLYWIYLVIQHYSSLPVLLCVGILILLCLVLALFWGVFGFVSGFLRNRLGLAVALLLSPFLWTSLEWARNQITQFPWCLLGYSQYTHLRLAQLASFAGIYGLSGLIVAFNASIIMSIVLRKYYYTTVCVAIAAGVSLYGHFRIQQHIEGPVVRAGLIQGNIPQDVKLDFSFADEVHQKHLRMTRELILKDKPDVIFWSEAATLFPIRQGGLWTSQLQHLVRTSRIPLILGSDTVQKGEVFNSAYLVTETGDITAQYDKVYLVPFGEFVPLKNIFSFAGKLIPEISDFSPGTYYEPFVVHGEKVSVNICFEVVFPQLSREFCRRGAGLLSTITNDAWFGHTSAPHQHFAMSVMRAIENRRYLVRAANTGISGFVDPYGRILQRTELFVPAAITGEVRWNHETTFYTRYGDWFVYLSLFLCGKAIVIALFIGRSRNRIESGL